MKIPYTEKLFFLAESDLEISVVHVRTFPDYSTRKNTMFPIIESWNPSNGPTWYKTPVIDNSVVFFGWFQRYRKPQKERRVFSLYSHFIRSSYFTWLFCFGLENKMNYSFGKPLGATKASSPWLHIGAGRGMFCWAKKI